MRCAPRHLIAGGLRRPGILVAVLLFAASVRADVRVVGTDLLGLDFTKALYAFAGREGVRLAVALEGSRPGIEQLKAGRADAALVLLPPEELTTSLRDFAALPIAYQTVVILAPAGCPVDEISFEELAAIFAARPLGDPTPAVRWRNLGAAGSWADELVAPLAPAGGNGVVTEYFRHAVLGERPLRRDLLRYASLRELAGQFGANSRTIVIAAALPNDAPGMKALRVAAVRSQPAVAMTPDTLHRGEYPLRLPLHLVFSAERRQAVAPIARFVFCDEALAVMMRADVVPLPATVRAQQRAKWDEARR